MPASPLFFERPDAGLQRLRVQPRLASWMAAGHPDRVRLGEFLANTEDLLRPCLAGLVGPSVLRLDVGLPETTPLLDQHDLDNYLMPLVARLSQCGGHRFVSVWSTKQHSDASSICVAPAIPLDGLPPCDYSVEVRTTASSASTAYKQQIHDQLADANAMPEDAVSMQLSFTVGPHRNWLNLWKPTIDALDQILGRTSPDRAWHPRDGRITELGLHCRVDPTAGNGVVIAIAASAMR